MRLKSGNLEPGEIMNRVAASSALSAVMLAVLPAFAQDWPQWRGPRRDGVVAGFAAPAAWPEKLKLEWKAPVGSGYSSPVVSQGNAWIHSRKDEEEVVSCVDLNTGKVLWTAAYPVAFTKNQYALQMNKGPFSTPVLYGGALYTLGITAVLSSFDAATGKVNWRTNFGPPDTSQKFTGTAMSPVIYKGNLIVQVGDDRGGKILALDAKTGKEKWNWTGDGPSYSSPVVVELAGTPQMVTMTDKSVLSLAADTGKLLWKMPWPDEWIENIVTPVVVESAGEKLLVFSGVRRGTVALRITRTGDAWEAKEQWRNAELTMYMNTPVAHQGKLYGMSNKKRGQFFCLEAASGKVLWATEGREGNNAATLLAGDMLFHLTHDANLVVARASEKGFERVAKYSVADSATYAHPILLGRKILIKDETGLSLWSLE